MPTAHTLSILFREKGGLSLIGKVVVEAREEGDTLLSRKIGTNALLTHQPVLLLPTALIAHR